MPKYIVDKATGKVVDRFIGKRKKGIVHSYPILLGSWFQEYPTKYYRIHESKRKLIIGLSKVRKGK